MRRCRGRPGAVRRRPVAAAALLALLCAPALAWGQAPPDPPDVAANRETEPVVLTGAAFGEWSVPRNVTAKLPLTDLRDCNELQHDRDECAHNHYAEPEAETADGPAPEGEPVDRLLGYRWERGRWVQVPFQVDEVFERYLDNSASGFAAYSGQDRHTSYAFDREGWRFTTHDPDNPCVARPQDGVSTMADPVAGLDHDDELAFMASDAGEAAPSGTPLPEGIESARAVPVADPLTGATRFVYVMLAGDGGPRPAFDAGNGYVRYERDPIADLYERSESNYASYGNAAKGPYCDAEGKVIGNWKRRPRDYATVTTPRYRFRYDGRWLMTGIRISPDGGETYGPDLVDRWKARAFAQDPGSETPCCGFEDEDVNWGGSSTLLGELSGPVRTIRETWGADSGTNVVRRETFYRDEVRQKSWLRVHPIPPLDGIYAQWDFNAGVMTRFYNMRRPGGVAVDGRNDEVFGNLDDPCNVNYDGNDTGDTDQGYRQLYRQLQLCRSPYHQSVDVFDPTFSEANASLSWSQTSGPAGTIVDRFQIERATDLTPGGAAQAVVAVPYYRDDSCFDDGTGSDPGPRLRPGEADEPREGRRCWTMSDGTPQGSDPTLFQGSIATHGVHLLFVAESDNARLTVPLTEIVSEQRMVMLPGDPGNVGERYGRGFEKPLVATVGPPERERIVFGPPPGDDGDGDPPPNDPPPSGRPPGPSGDPPGPSSRPPGATHPPRGQARRTRPRTRRSAARLLVRRHTRVRRGAFTVGCRLAQARRCAVTALAGRRRVGRGSALARGRRTAVVKVRLTAAGRRLLRANPRGLRVRLLARPVAPRAARHVSATTVLHR